MPKHETAQAGKTRPATPELSRFITDLIDGSIVPAGATIADIRTVALGDDIYMSADGEIMYRLDRTHLIIELDELIDDFGAGVIAREIT